MDSTLLPKGIVISNNNQRAFIQKASIAEICKRYQTYERSRNAVGMKHLIKTLKDILEHLRENGYVSMLHNQNTKWDHYFVNSDDVVIMHQNAKKTESNEVESVVTNEVVEVKKSKSSSSMDIHFDLNESSLSGIDLVCAIADKFRNLAFSARSRGIKFDLTLDDVQNIILTNRCYYSNVEFDGKNNIKSVDRLDNKKGYVSDNIVVCTRKINEFKNELIESKSQRLFNNIHDLKRFVDILYATQSTSQNPLIELLNTELLNTEKKG